MYWEIIRVLFEAVVVMAIIWKWKSEKHDLGRKIKKLVTRITELELNDMMKQQEETSVLDTMLKTMNNLNDELAACDRSLVLQEERFEMKEMMLINSHERESSAFLSQIKDLLDVNDSAKKDNQFLKEGNASLKEEIKSLKEENKSLMEENKSLIRKNKSLRTENESTKNDIKALTEQIGKLQQRVFLRDEDKEALLQFYDEHYRVDKWSQQKIANMFIPLHFTAEVKAELNLLYDPDEDAIRKGLSRLVTERTKAAKKMAQEEAAAKKQESSVKAAVKMQAAKPKPISKISAAANKPKDNKRKSR